MAREKEQLDEGINITFRLFPPHGAALKELAEATRAKSIHDMARTLLVLSLDQQPLHDALVEVHEVRGDIDELRKGLADLTEQEIKEWVFKKLWPKSE